MILSGRDEQFEGRDRTWRPPKRDYRQTEGKTRGSFMLRIITVIITVLFTIAT
jgi:hypothetical protein